MALSALSLMFLTRVVTDTGFRMLYPFIPQLSQGLNISVVTFTWLLTIRSMSNFAAPLIGSWTDRFGRRKVMSISLVVRGVGMVGFALSSGWWSVIPMILTGVASTGYLPAQQAYISDQVAYDKRGRALASVDIAYAVSGIVGLPLVGWAIEIWGWRMPFLIIGGLSVISAVLMWLRLPPTDARTNAEDTIPGLIKVLEQPNILASIGVAVLSMIGIGIHMTIWGIWLSEDFSFGAASLGWVATGVGIAELLGILASGLFIDRIGKRRGSLFGLIIGGILFLFLPLIRNQLHGILITIILLGLTLQFVITALYPLYAEQSPKARATVFSLIALGNAIGIGIGSPLTSSLWQSRGLNAISLIGFTLLILASLFVWFFLEDQVTT